MRWVCSLHKYHAGNNSNIAKSRRPICLLFLVYNRELRFFIIHCFKAGLLSTCFKRKVTAGNSGCVSPFLWQVSPDWNRSGICHHWHLIHADPLACGWAWWHLHSQIHIHGQKCQGGTCSYCISENELGALCLWNICFEWYYSSCDDLIANEALQNSIVQKGLWGEW